MAYWVQESLRELLSTKIPLVTPRRCASRWLSGVVQESILNLFLFQSVHSGTVMEVIFNIEKKLR